MFKKLLNLNKLYRILFFTSVILIILSFNLQHNPPSGWQKQMLPELNGRVISDMIFTDSLNGYATGQIAANANYILKTTDGGNYWFISDSLYSQLRKIQFLNQEIGYVCGAKMYKTTNAGSNWLEISIPFGQVAEDMYILNEDTIWFTNHQAFDGGIFLTTNAGSSWTQKYFSGGTTNPDKIYFANKDLGFATRAVNNYLRTSDGGNTWNIIIGPFIWFNDIYFTDSLTGYKANGYVMKTTDKGLTWVQFNLPLISDTISSNAVERISKLNNNTIYGVGPRAFYFNPNLRGLIFKTTNEGSAWGYQLPDTSLIRFKKYNFVNFLNNNTGWVYQNYEGGLYTSVGGDTTIYVSVKNISTTVPNNFELYQNYPNPFNPVTKLRFDILKRTQVQLKVYDISGREIKVLVNEELIPGSYETTFDADELSSGIYFCRMKTESYSQTIRMALVR